MFFLIMLVAVFTGRFSEGLFACFCILVACLMADALLFFVWATYLVSLVSSMFS